MTIKTLLLKFFCLFFVFVSLECFSQPLSPVSPKNGIVINNDSILLRWNKLSNAQFYELKYTTDSSFISTITSINVGLQTAYWLTPLSSNTTYYWRVEANTGTATVIGQARRFTNFKPTDLPGCALWLRADTGLTLNGNSIETWLDASANNFSVSQSTLSSQPTLIANSINGSPSVSFDGNDIFNISNFPFSSNVNCFVVAKKTNAAVSHGNIISAGTFELEMQTLKCVVVNSSNGIVGAYDAFNWSQITLKRQSGNSKVFFNGIQSGLTNNSGLNPIAVGNFTIGNRNPAVNSPTPFRGNISEIIVNSSNLSDSLNSLIQNYLLDKYTLQLSLGEDQNVIDNFCPIVLSATPGFQSYIWSNGDTSANINVHESGVYYVQAVDLFNRIQIDSIVVSYPQVNQLTNPVLCSGSQLIWNTNLANNYSFLWQDNSNASSFVIVQPGQYHVEITDQLGCVFNSDTLNVILDNFPFEAFIGNDTSLCTGNSIQLQVGASVATNYLWSNGNTNDSLLITSGGTFWLEVSNINNCIAIDTINISLTGIAPVADFMSNEVCIGLPTEFTDISTAALGDSIISWEWSFADGNQSALQNPVNTYLVPDNYLVTLKAISQTSCAGLVNKLVTVYPHPNVNYTVINNCNDKQTTFSDITYAFGGTITDWEWNFNDSLNATNSGNGNIESHTYLESGNYNVLLVVSTLEGCVDSIIKPIFIKQSPVAAFNHTKLCIGDSVTFQDVSLISFPHQNIYREWTFNDSLISTDYQPAMLYNTSASYPVKLIIMASNGCRDTISQNIFVSNLPNSDFTFNSPCLDDLTSFNDISTCLNCLIDYRQWTLNGAIISSTDSASYIFNEASVYSVNLEVKNTAGCASNIQKIITINPSPVASFSSSALFGSPPLIISFDNSSINTTNYNWDFGDGNSSEIFEPTHTFEDTGTFFIELIAIDSSGCSSNANEIIRILPRKIDIALLNVNFQIDNNYIFTDITFINLGSIALKAFNINMASNGSPNNSVEKWDGTLLPGEIKNYRLRTSFLNETFYPTDYVCINLSALDQGEDVNLKNNELCATLNEAGFKIANIYPNPVNDFLNLTLLAPYAKEATVQVVDYKGDLIHEKLMIMEKGFNAVSIETLNLQDGPYLLRVLFEGNFFLKTFIKVESK
jgi:PKD repeat protein